MSNQQARSWDDVVAALRAAASELRRAAGRPGTATAEEIAAEERLKKDVSRLQVSAAALLERLARGLEDQRAGIESSFDKERAERSATQVRSALEDLATMAADVTSDIASAASSSLREADPELKQAIRALEEVANSAAAWVRAAFDGQGKGTSRPGSGGTTPLDDL
jgi:hypothetical protein